MQKSNFDSFFENFLLFSKKYFSIFVINGSNGVTDSLIFLLDKQVRLYSCRKNYSLRESQVCLFLGPECS